MVVIEPSQFITDYRGFAIVMTVIFAVLGPLSLLTGIPAVVAAFRVSWRARLLEFYYKEVASIVPKPIHTTLKSWERGATWGDEAKIKF